MTLGCFWYYESTTTREEHAASKENYAIGVGCLIASALTDSALAVTEKRHIFLRPDAKHPLNASELAFGFAWWGLIAFGAKATNAAVGAFKICSKGICLVDHHIKKFKI